jgi:hypothetical protein
MVSQARSIFSSVRGGVSRPGTGFGLDYGGRGKQGYLPPPYGARVGAKLKPVPLPKAAACVRVPARPPSRESPFGSARRGTCLSKEDWSSIRLLRPSSAPLRQAKNY